MQQGATPRRWARPTAAALFIISGYYTAAARADTPTCDDVYNDPTIATCTCICQTGSQFTGCIGLADGTQTPTPDQCPDMLQGRRVLAAGDALAVAAPRDSGSTNTVALSLLYLTKNDPNNAGLGVVESDPALVEDPDLPCRATDNSPFPEQIRFMRLFDLPYDMLVTLHPVEDNTEVKTGCFATSTTVQNLALSIRSSNAGAPTVPIHHWQSNPQWAQLVVDDFNYDGFDDFVFLNIDSLQVYTAVDVSDGTQGIREAHNASTKLSSGAFRAPINEPASGDFNGDGLVDVAWIGGNFPNKQGTLSVFFATICPGPVTGTICAGATPFEVIVDPAAKQFPAVSGASSTIALNNATLTPTACGVVQTALDVTFTATDSRRAGAIALGNFEDNGYNPRGAPIDELLVAYIAGTNSTMGNANQCKADAQYWSFSAPMQTGESWAKQRGATMAGLLPALNQTENANPTFSIYARAAYLDWYGVTEQAVIGVSGSIFYADGSWWVPAIVSVAGTGADAKPTVCVGAASNSSGATPYAWGLAVGRFSTSTTVNPDGACGDFAEATPGQCPYNPQIAMLLAQDSQRAQGGAGSPAIHLYNVRASNPGGGSSETCSNGASIEGYLPVAGKVNALNDSHSVPVASLRGGSLLQEGDALGRSVRVGTPIVTRVSEHTEPQFVIQAPPSLVAYVQPNSADSATPAVVNFTRAPANYQAQVNFVTSQQDTASTQRTHSFSTSMTETLSEQIKFPSAYVGTVDIKNKDAWSQYNESSNTENLGTYSTTRLQTGAGIGADDQLWWTQTTFNVFHFPVLGQTNCPASTSCDSTDATTTGCTAAADGVPLTCSPAGDGCDCLSSGATAALCPAPPAAGVRACAEQGGDVCCSMLPQQLNVTFSGPHEVTRASSPGALIEWYQPKHEPGQILSYPSSAALYQARNPGAQVLANLTTFTTGTNDTSESISWTCSTTSSTSTGTTTRHSFESDTSITIGMNNINVQPIGAQGSFDFDYQGSGSISTLNSYSVGQTASSDVGVLLQGAGFFDVDEYQYSVAGAVFGATKPETVLDNPDLAVCPSGNPDCDAAQQVQADCTTTGPLTVAFAADPTTAGSGLWWPSTSPYGLSFDVALNNPSRWKRVQPSGVTNQSLQCRGPANTPVCYTSNQPPPKPKSGITSAADVWGALFYDMKGLLVTNGALGGPLRNSATVGTDIFLQLRVYNYSLHAMPSGTRVFARFYRQQLDVNDSNGSTPQLSYASDANGNPLPAVPIGPAGLGDASPVPVVSPLNGSATVSPFNNTTDPNRDNISLAQTSYITTADDACEYDSGIQTCNGAYYAYWVSVWAEDASGNVLPELAGHGLGSTFNPGTTYPFITEVPRETVSFNGTSSFTNNVGMYKLVFSIVPKENSEVAAAGTSAPPPGEPGLDRLHVSPDHALLGEDVIVSAQVTSGEVATQGATVLLYDGDPAAGAPVVDGEWLPRIRPLDAHYVRARYHPESCGTRELTLQVVGAGLAAPVSQSVLVEVGIETTTELEYLRARLESAELDFPGNAAEAQRRNLLRELDRAAADYAADRTQLGMRRLETLAASIRRLEREGRLDSDTAAALIAQSELITGCGT